MLRQDIWSVSATCTERKRNGNISLACQEHRVWDETFGWLELFLGNNISHVKFDIIYTNSSTHQFQSWSRRGTRKHFVFM